MPSMSSLCITHRYSYHTQRCSFILLSYSSSHPCISNVRRCLLFHCNCNIHPLISQCPLPFIHHLPIIHLSPILPSSSLFSLVSPTTYKKKPISTILLIHLHPHPFKTSEKQSKEKNNSRRQQILTPPTSKKRHGAPKNNHAAHHARVLGRRQRVVRLCEVSFGGWGAPGWGRGLDGDALFGWHF